MLRASFGVLTCYACKCLVGETWSEEIGYINWSLHEIVKDRQWEIFCESCEDVLELDYGK